MLPEKKFICVDASYLPNSFILEYRGLIIPSKEEIFHVKLEGKASNNIGEYLAIIEAIKYCENNKVKLPIYSDSQCALAWIRKKRSNSKVEIDNNILVIVNELEDYLKSTDYKFNLKFWETTKFGSIPSDFNRK